MAHGFKMRNNALSLKRLFAHVIEVRSDVFKQKKPSFIVESNTNKMAHDDWKEFAMELWGISITSWTPIPERAENLPAPLEYDTLQDGLVELTTGQRHMVLQCLSCYQVKMDS